MKQHRCFPAPRCASIAQSDADKLPVSEFCRSFSGVLASRFRVSPSPPSAGSFAGSCNLVLRNSLMPKHQSWRRRSESNRRMRLLQSPALPLGYPATPKINANFDSQAGQVQSANPNRRRCVHSSFGLKIPTGVMMPVINSGGVTSNPGFRAPLVGLATRT